MMKKIILSIGLLMYVFSGFAQKHEEMKSAVRARAEIHQGTILLRWIPTDEKAWRLLNIHGYALERLTIMKGSVLLEEPEKVMLAPMLKPTESDRFKELAAKYPMGAVVAQAIFGEEFEVGISGHDPISQAVSQAEEREQRYLFALYAADQCFPVAQEAGWGWEDTTAKDDERYLYRIIPLVPEKELAIESGAVFVIPTERTVFPKPLDLSAQFRDASVLLNWNYHTLSHLYPSYIIERSTDGKNFARVSDIPITRMGDTDNNPQAPITYLDSIANEVTHYYRVAGITPFGTTGEYSDVASGMAHRPFASVPMITSALPDGKGGADIVWEFGPEDESLLSEFSLLHSPNDKTYTKLKGGIAPSLRSCHIPELSENIYYKVEAVGKHNERKVSYPVLLQVPDTIPPAVPVGLTAQIDSAGCVRLAWKANVDKDIYGYRLYRGNTAEDEFVPLNDVAIQATSYVDSVSMKMLNSKVYYAVSALDKRYNQSDLSPVIVSVKPELIPPTRLLITEGEAAAGGNKIRWVSAGEDNIAGFMIYRRSEGEELSQLLETVSDSHVSEYTDVNIDPGKVYYYQVLSYTEGRLYAPISTEFKLKASVVSVAEGVQGKEKFTLTPTKEGVLIAWETIEEGIMSIRLYRKSQGEFMLFRDNLPSMSKFIDRDLQPGISYEYMLVIKRQGKTPVAIQKNIEL